MEALRTTFITQDQRPLLPFPIPTITYRLPTCLTAVGSLLEISLCSADWQFAGGCAKAPEETPEDSARAAEEPQLLHGAGVWVAFDPPVDVFVHQSKLYIEGFRSLKEGEAVEFTFKKSAKGLESIRVTGPGAMFCIGSETRPKGKDMQKHRSKGDRCYNCGGLDHHAKECKRPPQPKKCHFCQSINHVVASCPLKAQQAPSPQGKPAYFPEEEKEIHSSAMLPEAQNRATVGGGYHFVIRTF
ncbi:hypothetical protein K5549_003084 [Capra hircus]|nr:hypothetical protein K5549_003084 [Capra hircus]